MAPPSAVEIPSHHVHDVHPLAHHKPRIKIATSNRLDGPLKSSGTLDEYKSFTVTPVIGQEFPELQISDILNDDAKIRDLAILGTCSGPKVKACRLTMMQYLNAALCSSVTRTLMLSSKRFWAKNLAS